MTATAPPRGRHARPEDAPPVVRPSLLRAELLRLRSRRLLRVLLLVVLLGWLAGVVISLVEYSTTTPAELDDARQQIALNVESNNLYRAQCLADATGGDTSFCPPQSTAADFSPTDFVRKQPFDLEQEGADGALTMAVGLAVVAVLAGATWIGGEWSSRSMVGLLFWEPRRWRVHLVKAAVITVAAAAVAVVVDVLWAGAAFLLVHVRGNGTVPDDAWGDLLGVQARGVGLVAGCALIGYAVAGLVRNTGATLGIAFVYFAVAESAVRAIWTDAQAGLVTTNAVALVAAGGYRYTTYVETVDRFGMYSATYTEHVVSNLQGGLVLAGIAVALAAVSGLVLARRDVQ